MQSSFFRGTSHEQDARFRNKNKVLMAQLKFPKAYDIPVRILCPMPSFQPGTPEYVKQRVFAACACTNRCPLQIDMTKVAINTLKPWISQRITDLLGIEDDVVVALCINMIEDDSNPIDPRELQINLTGYVSVSSQSLSTQPVIDLAIATEPY
jgi:serine/arginine repetitive matrix protein 1